MKHGIKQYLKECTHNVIVHPLMMVLPRKLAGQLHDRNADWAFAARMDELALEGFRPEISPSGIATAMSEVIEALLTEPDYAWSWHCNVAMAAVDAGVPHKTANEAAARFLMTLAGVDTTVLPEYQALVRYWEVAEEGTDA